MQIIQYIVARWDEFFVYLEALVVYHQATGTLPPIPAPVVPPVVQPPAVALPTGTDTPDANGFVALTGLHAGHYAGLRYAIREIANTLPAGSYARWSAELNCDVGNGRSLIVGGFIGVGLLAEAGPVNQATGEPTYRLAEPEVILPNTVSLANEFTVASATDHFNALPEPSAGSGFAHP